MNREFFCTMQVEPSEELLSSLRTRISQESTKPSRRYTQLIPVTAAMCAVIIASVIILPRFMVGHHDAGRTHPGTSHESPEEHPVEEPAEIPEITYDVIYGIEEDYPIIEPEPEPVFIIPVDMSASVTHVSEWGHWDGGYRGHIGIDFSAPEGTDIYAVMDGVVIQADWSGGYGLNVIIDHGSGLQTWYSHCSELLVEADDIVEQGQTIALVGRTGLAADFHLHFEVWLYGVAQNPDIYSAYPP